MSRVAILFSLWFLSSTCKSADLNSSLDHHPASRQLSGELEFADDVTTFAGVTSFGTTNGIGTNSQFQNPWGVAISPDGGYALIGDFLNHLLRKIIISTIDVSTFVGAGSVGSTNGMGTHAEFNKPAGVAISPNGTYALVTDRLNCLIRLIVISTANVSTLAGVSGSIGSENGIGTNSKFYYPFGIVISPNGVYALVCDHDNRMIRQITISTGNVFTLAGAPGSPDSINGIGTVARFYYPFGIAISPDGVYALVADRHNDLVRKIIISTASVTTLAGIALTSGSTNGMGTNSNFNDPSGVAISPNGTYAFICDYGNHLIRRITISTASVTTLAGVAGSPGSSNGIGSNSQFNNPAGIAFSPDGSFALIADEGNNLIRQISSFLPTALPSTEPTLLPSTEPTLLPSTEPTFLPSTEPTFLPSTEPTLLPSTEPTLLPSTEPTLLPSTEPTLLPSTDYRFSFAAKIGDQGVLVDYLQDRRRGKCRLQTLLTCPSGNMIPISRVIDSSRVSSDSDPPLSSDSILVKWRPVMASGIGSWQNHTIIPGGLFLSWLVSLLSEEIIGFIVRGQWFLFALPQILQILSPQPISFISSNIHHRPLHEDLPSLTLASPCPSLPTRPSRLGQLVSMFLGSLTSVSTSSTPDW
jgi:DNA-binding beta-propeller fold protein YncE